MTSIRTVPSTLHRTWTLATCGTAATRVSIAVVSSHIIGVPSRTSATARTTSAESSPVPTTCTERASNSELPSSTHASEPARVSIAIPAAGQGHQVRADPDGCTAVGGTAGRCGARNAASRCGAGRARGTTRATESAVIAHLGYHDRTGSAPARCVTGTRECRAPEGATAATGRSHPDVQNG